MLEVEFSLLSASRVGPESGLELQAEFEAHRETLKRAVEAIRARAGERKAMLGWIRLPEDTEGARRVRRFQEARPWVRDLVVLGIGGSALGAKALAHALTPQNPPARLYFVDNVEPAPIARLLDRLDPATTLVVAISKSGKTAETMAAFLIFRDWLERHLGQHATDHLVAVTDPQNGPLRTYAASEGLASFDIPPDVGGRFSVFSAVGLLPLAFAGVQLEDLLMGARRANAKGLEAAAKSALALYLLYRYRQKPIHVLMPYSTRMALIPAWFVQLHAESLGKAYDRRGSRVHVGPTPLPALGATDQHSLLQLLQEGPFDKVVSFVRLRHHDHDLEIPGAPGLSPLRFLFGKRLGALLDAEATATPLALAKAGRPSLTIWIDRVDEASLGELLQFFMWQTAIFGELLGINAFDQPGVELAKQYTYALMGHAGYEKLREEIDEA